MRITVAVLSERLVRLADEKRELREFDRMQSEVATLRRKRHMHRLSRVCLRYGARFHPHPERELSAKGYDVAALNPRGLLAQQRTVHRRAVLAAEIGRVRCAVLDKDPRMAPRQLRNGVGFIGGER